MSVPYKPLPMSNGQVFQEFPTANKALVTRMRETAATAGVSSVITLNDNTTTLEVVAGVGPAFLRWVATTDTQASVVANAAGANFDNAIAPNTVRRFAVPIENFVAQTSVVGLNKQYGLYNRVALIGTASVASIEF